MAIAASYFTTVTNPATTSTALYTTSTTAYQRDLVVSNGGASHVLVAAQDRGHRLASTTVSFAIPAGQQLVLQGQVPNSTILYGFAAAAPAGGLIISLGWGSVVSVI